MDPSGPVMPFFLCDLTNGKMVDRGRPFRPRLEAFEEEARPGEHPRERLSSGATNCCKSGSSIIFKSSVNQPAVCPRSCVSPILRPLRNCPFGPMTALLGFLECSHITIICCASLKPRAWSSNQNVVSQRSHFEIPWRRMVCETSCTASFCPGDASDLIDQGFDLAGRSPTAGG